MDLTTITIDNRFLGMAITNVLQMRGELEETEFFEVENVTIDDDTGYLILAVSRHEVKYN